MTPGTPNMSCAVLGGFLHFGHGAQVQRTAEAHPLHARLLQFGQGQRPGLRADQQIDWLRCDRLDDGLHVVHVGRIRGIQHVGAGVGEGGQSAQDVGTTDVVFEPLDKIAGSDFEPLQAGPQGEGQDALSTSWPGWPRWCRRHGLILRATTVCSRRTIDCGNK